jgi:type IV pilus assembly protein PilW
MYRPDAKRKKPQRPALTENAGFTIAELILALGMMMIVMAAMIGLATSLNRTYTTQTVAAGVQHVTRAGLDLMVRNIRMAGFNPQNIDSVGIVEASPNALRFRYDLDGSGKIEEKANPGEDITYLRDADNQLVQLKDGNPDQDAYLVSNVKNLNFKYLDKDENETTKTDDIRVVVVSLTVEEPSGRGRPVSRTYQTRVICRNIGL